MSKMVQCCDDPEHPFGPHLCSRPPMTAPSETPQPWGDDVALQGPDAPKNNGKIKYLIEYLMTVYKRFGDTAVTAQLQWGATACWKRDEQAEKIASLETALSESRAECDRLSKDRDHWENDHTHVAGLLQQAEAEWERLRKAAETWNKRYRESCQRHMDEQAKLGQRLADSEDREREAYELAAKVLDVSADQLRLMMGELSASEMRSVKAVLNVVRGKIRALADERREP